MIVFLSMITEIFSLFLLILVFLVGVIYRTSFMRLKTYVYILFCSFCSMLLLYNNVVAYTSFFFMNKGIFSGLISLLVLIISLCSVSYLLQYNNRFTFSVFEYSIIFLFIVCSVIFMIHTYFLLLFFLFFEIHNVCLYILIPFSKNNGNFVESGLKYFILSSFSSIMMLLGISFLYYSFGTLNLLYIESILSLIEMSNIVSFNDFGFVFLLIGFLFKLYCVPFHFWVPDVYHGSPISTTFVLACLSYISVLFVFFCFFVNLRFVWMLNIQNILFFFIILCLLIGGIGGIFQKQLKRLIAYSSISSLGYVLYGFLDRNEVLYADSFYYFIIYWISLVGVFLLLFIVEVNLYFPLCNSIEVSNLENFSGFFSINKYYTILLTFLFFSISGIPPFIGFFAKFLILEQSLYNMHIIVFLLMFINSLCSCYFYFYFVKVMYYDSPSYEEVKLVIYYPSNIFLLVFFIVFFLVFGVSTLIGSDGCFQFVIFDLYLSILGE
jgi:NADH-quinone oxidoreductase subunit N